MKDTIKKVKQFTIARNWNQIHTQENLSKSISIEAGELLECFQGNSNFKIEEAVDELADVIIYCILMAEKLEVDLEEIVIHKLNKNEIKYPIEKSKNSDKLMNS